MGSAFGRSISHAIPGRRRSTQFTEIGRDEGGKSWNELLKRPTIRFYPPQGATVLPARPKGPVRLPLGAGEPK